MTRTMFVPDEVSIHQRFTKAVCAGWGGIAIWAIGYENNATWDALEFGPGSC
jgi:spore germination protein YaaH